LQAMNLTFQAMGQWEDRRQSNLIDGAAPFYDTYACADGGYMAVAALEERFYRQFLDRTGLAGVGLMQSQHDRTLWPLQKQRISEVLRTRTRDDWTRVFEGSDACVTPVLTLGEAPRHPHHRARGSFVTVDGQVQPGPAPRFSRTPTVGARSLPATHDGGQALADWGWSREDIARLAASGAMAA